MTDELENTPTNETAQPQQPSFGLTDLVFTLQIIEACTQRGAFKAEELSNVGAAYDRLKAFLVANNAMSNNNPNNEAENNETVPTVGE